MNCAAARVSVIIPCYRQAHYLGEAIESVLAQTHPEVEIVVVDDGSPDHTAEVAAAYPGVRCVRQRNQGLSAARNSGGVIQSVATPSYSLMTVSHSSARMPE